MNLSAIIPLLKNVFPFSIQKSREDLVHYWQNPSWKNQPEFYIQGDNKSKFLLHIIKNYASKKASILELGCNVGRNLHYLQQAGFNNLSGVELNEKAIKMLRKTYPDLSKKAKIYHSTIEEKTRLFQKNQFDVTFTMAVLEHIHPESYWIFDEIVRITDKALITIENEKHVHWSSFPRNYKRIFEKLGMKQVEEYQCRDVEGLGNTYFARVFSS
ncbi:methyltransferase domain-containing protein [Candidatus Gottesmanbacteria bacterium]|nr:methyltransferase domain-containing protein [Candidatus Gottesmanbacteria bacterium]